MAINSKEARKIAEKKRKDYFDNYYSIFNSLFNNSVVVENVDGSILPKRYLLRILREFGAIAYDKATKLYLRFVEQGIDVYGLPRRYTLYGYNGTNYTRKANEVVILRANDIKYAIDNYIRIQVEKLVDIDMSIEQNLEAIKTMTVAEVKDQSTLLSVVNEMESRRIGSTVFFKSKAIGDENKVSFSSTGATFLVDKLLETRKEIMNETLMHLGIGTSNTDKRERVQKAEVDASMSFTKDCINTLIDTFNYDAEVGGLAIRLKGNTAFYLTDEMNQEELMKEIQANE